MNWVDALLRVIKYLAIITMFLGFFILWTGVPNEKLNEPEVKYAPKQSKRST